MKCKKYSCDGELKKSGVILTDMENGEVVTILVCNKCNQDSTLILTGGVK